MIDAAKINYTSDNQTLNETDTLNLTCVADGYPTPIINWARVSDNKPVSFPLIISGKQDEGGYRCNTSNDVGSPDSRIVYVFVQSKFCYRKTYPLWFKVSYSLCKESPTESYFSQTKGEVCSRKQFFNFIFNVELSA